MFKKIGEVTSKATNGYSVITLIAGGTTQIAAGNIGDVAVFDDVRKCYFVVSPAQWDKMQGVEEAPPVDPAVALNEKIAQLEQEKQTLSNEKAALETQVQDLNNEKQELQNQITTKDASIATLQDEKTALQDELNQMVTQRDGLQNELSTQLIKNGNLQAKIDELRGDAQIDTVALRSENDSLKAQLESKTQLAEDYRIELETLKNASVPSSENALEP